MITYSKYVNQIFQRRHTVMSEVIRTIQDMQLKRTQLESLKIGFVPTMGNLHAGHLELVKQSQKENDVTIVSIFVNPTQFDNIEDLEKYPQTLEEDLTKLRQLAVDVVFMPHVEDIYSDNAQYSIEEKSNHNHACGKTRPGHFSGVLTIVMKLFNIVQPTRAYFGEKDYQQLELLRNMVQAFFMPIEVKAVPIVREASGLAMSSRNNRLSPEACKHAAEFYQILKEPKSIEAIKTDLTEAGFKVDYVEDYHNRRLAAVFLGEIRLIDNIELNKEVEVLHVN